MLNHSPLILLALQSLFLIFLPHSGYCEASKHSYKDVSLTSYSIDLEKHDLRLFWKDESGKRFGNVGALENWANKQNSQITFATNAGIFDSWFAPTGLHIENGKTIKPINLDSGWGNFFLKPNGVFQIDASGAKIVRSEDFKAISDIKLATQSGPLLVIDGKLHPAFKENSKNFRIRSGVGVKSNKEIIFAISNQQIRFYDFAMFFRQELKCNDALYLDGFISMMHIPASGRIAKRGSFAGIFAVLKPQNSETAAP